MSGRRQRNQSYSQDNGNARTAQQSGAVPRRRNNSTHQDQLVPDPAHGFTAAPGAYHGTYPNYNPPRMGIVAPSPTYGQLPNLPQQPYYSGYHQNGQYPHYNIVDGYSAQQPYGPHGANSPARFPPSQNSYRAPFKPPPNRPPSKSDPSSTVTDGASYRAPFKPPPNRPPSKSDPSSTITDGVSHITLSLEQYKKLARDQGKSHKKHVDHRGSKKTVCYSHLEGDVETAEICVFSIANACKFNDSGCKALHAKCPQHWQFRKYGRWYNFREFHSKELEEAFQKAECDGTQLSPLDPHKLRQDKSFADLEKLLGYQTWTADFDKMTIEDRSDSLDIRRISTRSFVLSKCKMATVFEWYFKDEKDNWIKYGQPNTTNHVDCIPNITSEEIETQFIKEKVPTFDFKSDLHEYVINFSKMNQTNQRTNTARPIRRRPKIRPMKGSVDACKAVRVDAVPSYWPAMTNTNIFELFELKPSDAEFQRNQKLMKETLPKCVILKMQRIQNPYLWNAYENKKKFIEKKIKSSDLNEKYLFHGTDAGNLSSICEQNLDWRLHGSNVGQRFGRGSYFSSSARYSDDYTRPGADGTKAMLVVKVIVGTVTLGNSLMSRPPLNKATGNLYDTTVNNVTTPTVFVKYDNQEYYPEYTVQYR